MTMMMMIIMIMIIIIIIMRNIYRLHTPMWRGFTHSENSI
jgi:hypothetical protein